MREGWSEPQVENFITYLNKHKHRIVNYGYLQAEGISTAILILKTKEDKVLYVNKRTSV